MRGSTEKQVQHNKNVFISVGWRKTKISIRVVRMVVLKLLWMRTCLVLSTSCNGDLFFLFFPLIQLKKHFFFKNPNITRVNIQQKYTQLTIYREANHFDTGTFWFLCNNFVSVCNVGIQNKTQ